MALTEALSAYGTSVRFVNFLSFSDWVPQRLPVEASSRLEPVSDVILSRLRVASVLSGQSLVKDRLVHSPFLISRQ